MVLTNIRLAPQTFDLIAYYEPRADFSLSVKVRRSLHELVQRHTRMTWMMGKHSGRPVMHTDIRGISIGTRIEVSRIVMRRHAQVNILSETFFLFVEAAERCISSGPIHRMTVHFSKARRSEPRAAAKQAFQNVFGSDCCFLARHKQPLEIGRAVVHQTLLEHLFESGAYNCIHQPRIEAVANEMQKSPGRYENHRFFVMPAARPGKLPRLQFCYSGRRPDRLAETAMRQKTEEHLAFVDAETLDEQSESYVSLSDYERASRRYGTLWVMQGDLIRALDRQRAAVLYLFLDEFNQEHPDRWYDWDRLYERQQQCPRINRASRNSSISLDISLGHLVESQCLLREKDRFTLHPAFTDFKHATFYALGQYNKRFD